MKPNDLKSTDGYMLIACLLLTIVVLSFFTTITRTIQIATKANTTTTDRQKARYNAESGLYSALEYLKTPDAEAMGATAHLFPSQTPGATYYFSITLVDAIKKEMVVTSTGYYYNAVGPYTAPNDNHPAQMAVIDARVRAEVVGDYFAAVPETLTIKFGSNLSNGSVYAKKLIFEPGALGGTKVEAAYYVDFVDDGTGMMNPTPPQVAWTGLIPNAQSLSSDANIPHIGAMNDYYYDLAASGGNPCLYAGGTVIQNRWVPPRANPDHVCYISGDLHIGNAGTNAIFSSQYVFYVQGITHIEGSVLQADKTAGDWPVILSAGDIIIEDTAPDDLELNMTMVTEGNIMTTKVRKNGNLKINGGLIAQGGISLSDFRASRTYSFGKPPNSMKLPFLVQLLSWVVRQGKFM